MEKRRRGKEPRWSVREDEQKTEGKRKNREGARLHDRKEDKE